MFVDTVTITRKCCCSGRERGKHFQASLSVTATARPQPTHHTRFNSTAKRFRLLQQAGTSMYKHRHENAPHPKNCNLQQAALQRCMTNTISRSTAGQQKKKKKETALPRPRKRLRSRRTPHTNRLHTVSKSYHSDTTTSKLKYTSLYGTYSHAVNSWRSPSVFSWLGAGIPPPALFL